LTNVEQASGILCVEKKKKYKYKEVSIGALYLSFKVVLIIMMRKRRF
jgi:hypothetical protein